MFESHVLRLPQLTRCVLMTRHIHSAVAVRHILVQAGVWILHTHTHTHLLHQLCTHVHGVKLCVEAESTHNKSHKLKERDQFMRTILVQFDDRLQGGQMRGAVRGAELSSLTQN